MANWFSNLFTEGQKPPPVRPFREAGVSGAAIVGGYIVDRERNQKLTALQRQNTYSEMVSNIAIVAAGVRYFTDLGASAKWSVEPSEADTNGEYAAFVERTLFEELENPWSQVIAKAISYKLEGHSISEWVARRNDDGTVGFRSIERRPTRTIERWLMNEDGDITAFGQRVPMTGEEVIIPRAKTLYLVDDIGTDSPAGLGILRQLYESCERLQNYQDLELQGLQKDLRGIPVGRIPYAELNAAVERGEITEQQMNAAVKQMENLVGMVRKTSTTGLTLDSKPYISQSDTALNVSSQKQWDIDLLEGSSSGLADIHNAIERVQREIARTLSAEGLLLHGSGSQALAKEKNSMTFLSINSTLTKVKWQAQKDLLGPLWKLNGFDNELKPKLTVEEVNDLDAFDVADAMAKMAQAGAILSPDDEVINHVRDVLGIPKADLDGAIREALI